MKLSILFMTLGLLFGVVKSASFPRLIWYGPATPRSEDLRLIREAGFTDCLFSAKDSGQNLAFLREAESLGLFCRLSEESIDLFCSKKDTSLRRLDSLTQLYLTFKSFRGFLLFDKPGLAELPAFAELADFFSGKYPQLSCFVQAHPHWATPAQLDTADYRAYAALLTRKSKVKLITVECPGIRNNRQQPGFFETLAVLRSLSIDTGLPFWGYVLLEPVGQPPQVPLAHIRMQVYAALAYGAKGLQYAFFRADPRVQDAPSIVDEEGRLTPTYDYCAAVNKEAARLAPTLLSLRSLGVYAAKPTPPGVPPLPPGLPIAKIDTPDVLVALFADGPRRYAMVVNTDFRYGKRCRLFFSSTVAAVEEIAKNNAPPYVRRLNSQTDDYVELIFKAGEGRLFKLLP